MRNDWKVKSLVSPYAAEKAKYWESRAGHVEHREKALEHAKDFSDAVEGHFEEGEQVIARFTNCNRFHAFPGVIVGRTKGEAPGRVFYIPTASSRKFSQNNRIVKVCAIQTLGPDDSIKPCILAKEHEGFCNSGAPDSWIYGRSRSPAR